MFVGPVPLTTPALPTLPISSSTEVLELQATPTTDHLLRPFAVQTTPLLDDPVTVYTQAGSTDEHPTFELIVPTITTNSFPSGYAPANSSFSNYTSGRNNSSYSLLRNSSSYVPKLSSSTLVPIYSDYESSSSTVKSSSVRSSTIKSSVRSSTSRSLSLLTRSPTLSTSYTTSSFSSSSSTKSTKTVTEYLEDITYTQVYVVTDSQTTITTSLLATTTLYVDSLSSTYVLSPPAITTDINALKSRPDFDFLFTHHGLGGGSIAGIVIACVFGLGFLSAFFYYLFKKKIFFGNKNKYTDHFQNNEEESDDGDDDNRDNRSDYEESLTHRHTFTKLPPMIPPPDVATSIASTHTPPLINRDNKPSIFNSPPKPLKPLNTNLDDDLDMSLFDMHTAFNEINSSTKHDQYILPPIPKLRKNSISNSINSIDKMNYHEITSSPKTPLNLKLSLDRTMGVLYESPNEQCIWDEFSAAKNSGLINTTNKNNSNRTHSINVFESPANSIINSPIYSPSNSPTNSPVNPKFDTQNSNFNQKTNHYMQQLNVNGDYDDTLRANILNSNRVRSGSGATRYDYIANSVNAFKYELEKERLASPLKTTFDFTDEVVENDDHNDSISKTLKPFPPPVPKPRKNV